MNNNGSSVFLSELLITDFPGFIEHFMTLLIENGVKYEFLSGTNDYWLRDFMPIQINPTEFVLFSLTKDYYYKRDWHKRTNPIPICEALSISPIIPVIDGKSIYLDGGNVVLNNRKVIITEKVFKDNKDIPVTDLVNILKEVLKIDNVIIIPVEPGDNTGHSDGMVRWVDQNTVVANDYSQIDVPQWFKDKFYGVLLDSDLKVLSVPYNPVYDQTDGYQSAIGCYINYLQVEDKIFLPTFKNPVNDELAIKRFGEIFGSTNIIPIPSSDIARFGGVLNCLTWGTL